MLTEEKLTEDEKALRACPNLMREIEYGIRHPEVRVRLGRPRQWTRR